MDREKLEAAASLLEECGINLHTLLHDADEGLQEVDPDKTAQAAKDQEARAATYLRAARYLR